MLHLNKDGSADLTLASKSEEIVWKVLVMDKKSQAVISSVLRVNDLLRCGITVHALVSGSRSPLPDVPAIYFVEPSVENVSQIIQDLQNDVYDSFYVNFTSTINRELLEDFAKKVSLCGKGGKIKQVYDQYLDFIVTEPNLFLLDMLKTFTRFNSPATSEDTIHRLADGIADGLLASLVTMNCVPIIRCPKNGPAELVATQLDMKLRDYSANSRSTASLSLQQRPVLIILDRNVDLASMFSHSWIYQCMVSDVFELRRNTIKVVRPPPPLSSEPVSSATLGRFPQAQTTKRINSNATRRFRHPQGFKNTENCRLGKLLFFKKRRFLTFQTSTNKTTAKPPQNFSKNRRNPRNISSFGASFVFPLCKIHPGQSKICRCQKHRNTKPANRPDFPKVSKSLSKSTSLHTSTFVAVPATLELPEDPETAQKPLFLQKSLRFGSKPASTGPWGRGKDSPGSPP
jgi:hypothetical protein